LEEKMKFPSFIVLALFLALPVFSQTQAGSDAQKRDVFVILDISGSMNQQDKFTNVQDYLDREVISGLLKNGDNFTLITFGDSAAERFSRGISSDADKTALRAELRAIRANNDYTDIGMAMEKLSEVLGKHEEAGVRRVILFITDGLNAPPQSSPYRGRDLAVDDRFREIGEKISRDGWFLYVVGIGGETDARIIANAVPGSVFQDAALDSEGLGLGSFAEQVEQRERAGEEALAVKEEARRQEEARLELEKEELLRQEAANKGFLGSSRRLAAAFGIPFPVLLAIPVLLLVLVIFVIVLLARIFRAVEILISDDKETLTKKLAPFGSVTLNSPSAVLPGIGDENSQICMIQRSAFGLKVKILDAAAIADNSPYKKEGTMKLKGVINLANGRMVRAAIK
jgi:hypothetical protein